MNYTEIISSHLKETGETWQAFSRRAGISRSALYKTLKGNQDPRIGSVEKILAAIGYKIVATPTSTPAAPPESE